MWSAAYIPHRSVCWITTLLPASQEELEEKGLSQTNPAMSGKAAAGAQAAQAVAPGMKLGLGTGSTVAFFLDALGNRYQEGELPGILGVPTSLRTEKRAGELGIPLATLEEVGTLDLMVDGADEVDPQLDLIKGLGGALLREKMVAQVTQHLIIIVDEGKLVDRLGTRSPLPVEVVPFSWKSQLPFLRGLGAEAVLRVDFQERHLLHRQRELHPRLPLPRRDRRRHGAPERSGLSGRNRGIRAVPHHGERSPGGRGGRSGEEDSQRRRPFLNPGPFPSAPEENEPLTGDMP